VSCQRCTQPTPEHAAAIRTWSEQMIDRVEPRDSVPAGGDVTR
jgi:hypothetical protein